MVRQVFCPRRWWTGVRRHGGHLSARLGEVEPGDDETGEQDVEHAIPFARPQGHHLSGKGLTEKHTAVGVDDTTILLHPAQRQTGRVFQCRQRFRERTRPLNPIAAGGRPIADRQAIQWMIVEIWTDIQYLRTKLYEAAWKADQGQDVRMEASLLKYTGAQWATRSIDKAIQIHGGVGLTTELPLEYWYRQLRSLRITEGVTEVLRWRLARNMLRARG